MAEMLHEIEIAAPVRGVFEALTTQKGLRSWWTSDVEARPSKGSVAVFGFGDHSTVFRMRLDELQSGKRVVWTCLGDVPEWKGTRLSWTLAKNGKRTRLRLAHGRWRSTRGWFATCNSTWGELLHRLKAYLEGRRPGPHFK